MANTSYIITNNATGGIQSRLTSTVSGKNLINLDVFIEDRSDYSPYYFNIIRKPLELKLGGNIFEFSPPRNRFKLGSRILFEVVDSQNNPLPYEILPQKSGSSSMRVCIFIYDTTARGPAVIVCAAEALIDECGCPVPEEWEGKINCRWMTQAPAITDDVSDIIEYDTAPSFTISETKIPWSFETFEDVYTANPLDPGSSYTVSGSYLSKYDSTPTGSNGFRGGAGTGKFTYLKSQRIKTESLEEAVIEVYSGNLRFSSSMIGGQLIVSGGHYESIALEGGNDPFYWPDGFKPNYTATIVSIESDTKATVTPWYYYTPWVGNPEGGLNVSRAANSFDAKLGGIVSWTETSSSTSFTDPTIPNPPGTMTQISKTVEQHTSYADLTITGLKPICGVTTDIEVFCKSDRVEGPLTKLTEFPIEITNISINDTETTGEGNSRPFDDVGAFSSTGHIAKYWEVGASGFNASGQVSVTRATNKLMDAAKITTTNATYLNKVESYITFKLRSAYIKTLESNTNYFVEFDAFSEQQAGRLSPKLDIYISGSSVEPTNKSETSERVLGQYIGTAESQLNKVGTGAAYIGNSFEFKNDSKQSVSIIFALRAGTWHISNFRVVTSPEAPSTSGITPNTIRALVPMPAITRHNDQYTFQLRYKNKNATSNKISTLSAGVQFAGNDPSVFLAGQPNQTILSPMYNAYNAVTMSKNFYVTGSVFVDGTVFSNEFHTTIKSSSIIFASGSTIFGDTIDDRHFTTGSVYITSSLVQNITNEYIIKRPGGVRVFTILKGNITQSGEVRIDKPGTTTPAIVIKSDATGVATIANGIGDPVILLDDGDRNLYFFDKGDEHIKGDGTDLTLTSGTDIKLTPGTAVHVATGKPIRFGDTGEYVSGDDTDLTIASGNDIKLTPTTAVLVATSKPIRFGDSGEYISGDDTDLTIASGNEIKLNPTTAVLVNTSKPIRFGDSGEYISGDDTDLTIASGNDIKLTPTTAVLINTNKPIRFRDTGLAILSSTDGQLDIDADTELEITAPTVDIDASTTVTMDSPIVDINASTGLALDGANLNSDWTVNTTKKIIFRDSAISINSPADAEVDIISDKYVRINSKNFTVTGSITGSSNISASGHLFASTSNAAGQPYLTVLVDTGSGQFYFTGSYGGGGGGGTSAEDATITLTAGDGLKTGGNFTTNQSGDETITFDVDVSDFAGTGLTDEGSENLAIDVEGDKGNAKHFVPFLDGESGPQQLKTSPNFTYNPALDVLKVGMSVYIHGSGSVTASKNIWVSGSTTGGNFISGSNIISSHHITASGNVKATSGSFSKGIRIVHPDNSDARGFTLTNDGAYHLQIRRGDGVRVADIHSDNGNEQLTVDGGILGDTYRLPATGNGQYGITALSTFPGGISVGHDITSSILMRANVTASGNFSASGYISGGGAWFSSLSVNNSGVASIGGSDTHIQFNDGGSQAGEAGLTFKKDGINHLNIGDGSGDSGSGAVTISNAKGTKKSSIHVNDMAAGTGQTVLWNRADGKFYIGGGQVTTQNGVNENENDGLCTETEFCGALGAGSLLTHKSPAVYIASGSITFYSGSVTSSFGHMATSSAIFDMVYEKAGDKSSFIMSGSKNAKLYFSGSNSGKIGIGTTDPQVDFEVAADEHIFRRKETLIGLKINAEGNVESFNKDAAFSATGSELILSYTAGGKSTVTAAGIRAVFGTGAIAADANQSAINTFFDLLKPNDQAELLQHMEKIGEFGVGADQTGDVIGSIRWVIASGSAADSSDDVLESRTAGEAANIKNIITGAGPDGVQSKLQLAVAKTTAGAPTVLMELQPGAITVTSSIFMANGFGNITMGSGPDDTADKKIIFNSTTSPFIIGQDDSADKFAIHSAAAFVSTNDFTMDASGNIAIEKNLDVDGDTTLDNLTVAGAIDLDATTLDIDATGLFSLDSVGLSIDNTNTAANITSTADGAGEDFTIALAGATDSSLILSSTGTAADALQITTTAGGIDITNGGAAAGEDIDITSTNASVNITSGESAANAILLHADGGTAETIKIHSDQGTGAGSIEITSDAGSIDINSGDNITIDAADDIIITADNLFTDRAFAKSGTSANARKQGDIVRFGGSGTIALGDIVYLKTDNRWTRANADDPSTATSLMGIALGSDVAETGILLRGMFTLDHDLGDDQFGLPVYLSTTIATATMTAPSGTGDIVRIIGYQIGNANEIWFDPDKTWVELT